MPMTESRKGAEGAHDMRIEQKITEGREKMTQMMGEFQENIGEKVDDIRGEIQERPFLYTAVAFGLGVAIGYIIHNQGNGHRRYENE
ncbi:MAG TPA: hypothetical protein HA254_07055 [Candidatus Diapherotrites archaeon]|uniref:DUF883 domain-containing protein n=1 Tax=Candidatus Iainarchaeum sp. TaxID=3101447 RepID=A0A7J4IXX8_9ARCH|nr:hypothetical protein [Candidatus Diapherotrites archaeon]